MNLKIKLISSDAIIPTKAHESDSGFDISIIKLHSKISDNVFLYHTGLIIEPEPNFYTEIVARSSLMKKGYMLANNIGIIDNEYRGELLIALYKFDQSMPFSELQLPQRVAQLIPRQIISTQLLISDNVNLETKRNEGGFGSSGY